MRRIRAVVFDMDGVLLLSSAAHEKAFREALQDHSVGRFEYREIAGMRTREAIKLLLKRAGIVLGDKSIAELATAKSRLARRAIETSRPFAPEAEALLPLLAHNHTLGLASSGSEQAVQWFLDASGWSGCFQVALHGGDVRNAKPSPEIYTLAVQRLECSASECLVIEDAVSGVAAGRAAGASVWALPGTSDAAELKAAGAERILASLDDLRELCV